MPKKILICVVLLFLCFSGANSATLNKGEEDAFYVAAKAFEDGFYDVSLTLFDRFLKTYMDSQRRIEALIYIGQSYYMQEKYVKALEQFESLLKMDGTARFKDKILFWLGEIYSKGRDYKHAVEFYRELIAGYKNSFYLLPATRSLASALFGDGKYDEALKAYRSIISDFDDNAAKEEAFFGICELLYRTKDYANLKSELEGFIDKFPESKMLGRVYFYLGEASFYLNHFDEALKAYTMAEAAASSDQEASLSWLGIGWTYLKLKKYGNAEQMFSRFGEENVPTGVLLGKAVLQAGLEEYDKALKLFDKVILEDKSGEYATFAHFGRAEVLYNLSRFDDAIVAYRISLDKLKVSSGLYADTKELRDKIYYGLAWAYLKIGDFPSAQEAFQKIVSLSTDRVVKLSALVQLADTFQDAGEYSKAIDSYQQFLTQYPDTIYNDYIQYQLGMTWLKMDNLDSGVLAFRKLLEGFPSSQLLDDASYFLGLAYFRKNDFSACRKQLEQFLTRYKSSPYRPGALFLLGESMSNMGDFKSAIDIFNIVISDSNSNESLRQKAEYEIASVYESMGNEAEANKRLSDFIARYPDSQLSPDILFWLGQSYSAKKDFITSRKYFERLVRNYPDHELSGDCLLEIGITHLEEGNQALALRSFQQVEEKGRGSALNRAWILSGDIYLARGESEKAVSNYKEAIRLGGATAKTASLKIAQVYKQKKMFKEAIEILDKALAIEGPESDASIQFDIAELFEETADIQQALDAYLKVAYLYPDDSEFAVKSLLRVARIYENKNNLSELVSILEKIEKCNCPEAKYASEKLARLREETGAGI